MRHLRNRIELPIYLKELELNGLGVEIGVADGWYSKQILQHSDLKILFSVDPWNQSEAAECNLSPPEFYSITKDALQEFKDRSVLLRMDSASASQLFQDSTFDFIYIDGDHTQTRQDMNLWYRKLRPGGILSGHDYCDFHTPVKDDVDKFISDLGLTLYTTELDFIYAGHSIRSWYTRKPIESIPMSQCT